MISLDVLKLLEKMLAALRRMLNSLQTCPGPQLLRFTAYVGPDGSRTLGERVADSYGSPNVIGCFGLYVQGKDAMDNDWYTIDEIFEVIEWIANGWYAGEQLNPFIVLTYNTPREEYRLERRRKQIPVQESGPFFHMPRLVRLSSPNTYSSSSPDAFIPIRIETRGDQDGTWTIRAGDADYWLFVLQWFETGLYKSRGRRSEDCCVFERK